MPSIIIAAHNEESAIGRCLEALAPSASARHPVQVIVVANGCSDGTAAVASGHPHVRVIDTPTPGKANALNLGDAAAELPDRIYLDADIVLPAGAVDRLMDALDPDGVPPVLAAVPTRRVSRAGCSPLVRAYLAVHTRLPVFATSMFGRGVMALSAAGRARFDTFPEIIADDLFVDAQFGPDERVCVADVTVVVGAPATTAELLRRLTRVRRGNAALRADRDGVRAASRGSWLREVVLPRPWLLPAAVVYVALTLLAAWRARRATGGVAWSSDRTIRPTADRTGGTS